MTVRWQMLLQLAAAGLALLAANVTATWVSRRWLGGLQDRVVGLFSDSLCRRGFLGLGAKESLRFVSRGSEFTEVRRDARIYQKVA